MGADWKPDKEQTIIADDGTEHSIYLWVIKDTAKKEEPKNVVPKVEPKKELMKVESKNDTPKIEPKKEPETKVEPKKEPDTIKVPYVPTPQTVVDEMLKFASVKEGEVVYDLGCGDGRIVVTAVKDFKAKKGIGIDIDPQRIKESNENAKVAKVQDKVEFRVGDVLQIKDVSEANVVALYLFPELNERLAPMLWKTLKPGSRIVSHDFLMGDKYKPDKEITVKDGNGDEHTIYLWTIPEKK
jgi:SAM-dependent methyltransferase